MGWMGTAMETEYDTPDIEQRNAPQGAQVIQIESTRLVPVLIAITAIASILSGIALGFALKASAESDSARRQARASEMRVEGFTRALIAHNIDPYPHIQGEDP